MSQARSFGGNSFENVVDEAVHDAHGFARNAGVRVNLLQHFVDVDRVAFLPLAFALLVALRDVLLGLSGLLGGFSTGLGRHDAMCLSRRLTID